MTTFQFPLQRALDWRLTQLQLAEARVEQQLAALAAIEQAYAQLDATGQRTELEVGQFARLEGGDLSALGSYRLANKVRAKELAAKRAEFQKELAARQTVMLESRRRCRLLERLKERRKGEWDTAFNRELEAVAAESFLAQWNRGQA